LTELDWLYNIQGIGVKLGLDNMRRLSAALPVAQPSPPPITIHVAGTNGKGSVCAIADAIVRAHGLRCGLFTSPHLVHFYERMRVDGEMISESASEKLLAEIRQTISNWQPHPSFFEITLGLALSHFYESQVDYLILETGLGGRLDASNALEPRHVSVITPIDYDHTRILGATLGKIATEKAGIMRAGVPVLCAPQAPEALAALQAAAERVGTSLAVIDQPITQPIALAGRHQRTNAALAIAAVKASGLTLRPEAVQSGLNNIRWPGRFHRLGSNQHIIIDGAHNVAAAQVLINTWQQTYDNDAKATLIFGCARDKYSTEILEVLAPICERILLSPIRSHRTANPESILADNPSLASKCRIVASLGESLTLAEGYSERILIAGSLFLAGEALASLQGMALPQETAQ
jgi:dihydrofolate synthase/folylpolyglutamate synthase